MVSARAQQDRDRDFENEEFHRDWTPKAPSTRTTESARMRIPPRSEVSTIHMVPRVLHCYASLTAV